VHNDPRHGTGKSEDEDDELAAGETLSILSTLHSWARIVREERDLTDAGPVTISGEVDLLNRHIDFVCAQPWCDEAFTDVQRLVSQLRAANGHRADKPFSKCPVITNNGACSGQVWIRDELQPVWRRYIDRCAQTWEAAPGSAVCDTCHATWTTPAEKARLQNMVDQAKAEALRPKTEDGRRMLTAQELVDAGRVSSVRNVRTTVSRMGKSAVRGHYDPEWFGKVSA